jgi:hypothetical protein
MIRARVVKPAYYVGFRMYIDLEIDGRILTMKVPHKYGRVMCTVIGLVPVQSLQANNLIDISFDTKRYGDKEYRVITTICTSLQSKDS